MRRIGSSLAQTLYSDSETILLCGELGAGKTSFVQGFAEGLGINKNVISPSFALEQRYGETLAHIDLYRLSEKDANDFLQHIDDYPGHRAIEWPERCPALSGSIGVTMQDTSATTRNVEVQFRDIDIPSDADIASWLREAMLPAHIIEHMNTVADVAQSVARHLIASGRIVRTQALRASAMLHDLLRFVDFASWEGDAFFTPSTEEKARWKLLRETFGTPHEKAVAALLRERGYPAIAAIVETHRGMEAEGGESVRLQTIEQKILAYADKRVRHAEVVSLDERFDDFKTRYGKGAENEHAKAWRMRMKTIESEFFPDGTPPV